MKHTILSRNKALICDSAADFSLQRYFNQDLDFKTYIPCNPLFQNQIRIYSKLSSQAKSSHSPIITPNIINVKHVSEYYLNDSYNQIIRSNDEKQLDKGKENIHRMTTIFNSVSGNRYNKVFSLIKKVKRINCREIEVDRHFCLFGEKTCSKEKDAFMRYKEPNDYLKRISKNSSLPLIINQFKQKNKIKNKNRLKFSEIIKEEMKQKIFKKLSKANKKQPNIFDFFSNSQISKAIFLDKNNIHIEPSTIYLMKQK